MFVISIINNKTRGDITHMLTDGLVTQQACTPVTIKPSTIQSANRKAQTQTLLRSQAT